MEINLTYLLVWYSDRVTEIDVSSIILGPWSHFVLFSCPSGDARGSEPWGHLGGPPVLLTGSCLSTTYMATTPKIGQRVRTHFKKDCEGCYVIIVSSF